MRAKAISYLIDVSIGGGGVGAIWGLSLADWDHVTRIIATVAVTVVSITLAILHHRRKK
jgi:hypothetical protein